MKDILSPQNTLGGEDQAILRREIAVEIYSLRCRLRSETQEYL